MSYYGFRPYVPVAKRRQQVARQIEKLKKQGCAISPVIIEGRTIARNFWGKAWCENSGALFRLREPSAARPDLCAQRFRGRSTDRARPRSRNGERL